MFKNCQSFCSQCKWAKLLRKAAEMTDSSSSSDEEEKAKLKSAIWQSSSSKFNQKDKKTFKAQPKQSLRRDCDELEEQEDYRNVNAPPQLKSFIAKKLTSWLDSSIQEVDGKAPETLSSTTIRDDLDADFQLFSTSKPGPIMEEGPQLERRRRRPPSSSDSDSDAERSKLASVAVSYEQVLQSSRPQTSQDQQVTPNLLPTNNVPVLTSTGSVEPNGASQAHNLNSKKRKQKCLEGGASDEKGGKGCHGNGTKKKKHKKKLMEKACEFTEEAAITDTNVQTEVKMSQDFTHRLEKLPTSTEDTGSENPSGQPMQTLKKSKKKRKKCKMDRAVAGEKNDPNNSEASVR